MTNLVLHPKVAAPLLAGWVTTLLLYGLNRWLDVSPPAEVGAAILSLVTFACGWFAPTITGQPVADVLAGAPPVPTQLPAPAPVTTGYPVQK